MIDCVPLRARGRDPVQCEDVLLGPPEESLMEVHLCHEAPGSTQECLTGLASYSANLYEVGRQAARLVDRIIKGAKPGDVAVEQPTKFELVINLKAAKALGITIPQSIRLRADRLIP